MKCLNKITKNKSFTLIFCIIYSVFICGCKSTTYELPYETNNYASSFNVISGQKSDVAILFAEDLCVTDKDVYDESILTTQDYGTALLFNVSDGEVIFAKDIHKKVSPASLTKILTAVTALKYAKPDTVLTATNAVYIHESGAQLCGIEPGDSMTLNQALYIALTNSANDAAMLIAENVGGSVDNFVAMMNEEAKSLGATNSNFVNPHGLTDENQYTTAYDLYLILNEAVKNEKIVEIIQTQSYTTTYYDRSGKPKEISVRNTNKYVNGDVKEPENVDVIGGKTGTTNAAGHCLMIMARDRNGSPYIGIIMKAGSRDNLYAQMTELLVEIAK